jgi:hypothetical protein
MVAQLYPQALGSLFVASYDSQGYGGGIRPRLHAREGAITSVVLKITPRHGPRGKHSSSIVVEVCLLRRCIATVAARTV